MNAQLQQELDRIDREWLALTHEDLEELYAREGYGCKACDKPTSDSWWRIEHDIYCASCKRRLWRELRVRGTRVLTRAEAAAS